MNIFFISDLHFSHARALTFTDNFRAKSMQVSTIDEHDAALIERINQKASKRSILYILGDLGKNWQLINQMHCEKRLLLGNHDLVEFAEYAKLDNTKIIGCRTYKRHWLTHIPMHPAELYGKRNIHGHVHTKSIPDANYINVSVEMTGGFPIPFDVIKSGEFQTHNIKTPDDVLAQLERLNIK